MDRFVSRRLVSFAAALALILAPASLLADASVRAPAPPTSAQAVAVAKRLWSAIRSRDPKRIAGAVAARVHLHASLAELVVKDDFETDVERARFAERMTTLELGTEAARDWHLIAEPPLSTPPGTTWVGAAVASSTGEEGHGARIADVAFGVRIVDGHALVVAFDINYGESHLIFSR
jgi:hypothetical protein